MIKCKKNHMNFFKVIICIVIATPFSFISYAANGTFDIDQFMELNSKPSSHIIISDPQFEQQNQRLQAFREAGYQDAAAQDQGLAPTSGINPQTIAEETAYNEGAVNYTVDSHAKRDLDQALGDNIVSFGVIVVKSLGSLIGITEGTIEGSLNPNSTIDETVSRNLSCVQSLTNYLTDMQSDELKARQKAQAMRFSVQKKVDQSQYEQDIANGMSFTEAGIRDFGRDITRYFSTQDTITLMNITIQ